MPNQILTLSAALYLLRIKIVNYIYTNSGPQASHRAFSKFRKLINSDMHAYKSIDADFNMPRRDRGRTNLP